MAGNVGFQADLWGLYICQTGAFRGVVEPISMISFGTASTNSFEEGLRKKSVVFGKQLRLPLEA